MQLYFTVVSLECLFVGRRITSCRLIEGFLTSTERLLD